MGSSSNGGSGGVPPGFRFHPTDEELLHYYLKKKVSFHKFEMEVIRDIDLNKLEPWDLQERCRIGSTPQNDWYFFSHKDRKYPTGSRTNRATNAGFWKATGRDKCIRNSFQKIGMRKTLVFYRGRAPHGQKTDWIMHEYRLEDSDHATDDHSLHQEDGWVVCRVFKKKNLFKLGGATDGGSSSTTTCTNNINTNSSSTIPILPDHHRQLLLNSTSGISTSNNIMQANLQYYDLLRQQPAMPHHHQYLMVSQHQAFELNDKPSVHNNAINTRDHELALHSYAPHHQYYHVAARDCDAAETASALRYGEPPPAAAADQWTMLATATNASHDDGDGGDEAVLLPGSLSHGNNAMGMDNNQLSLGATTAVTNTGTAEMNFWGGYAK